MTIHSYSAGIAEAVAVGEGGGADFGFPGFRIVAGPSSLRYLKPALRSLTSQSSNPVSKMSLPIKAWALCSTSARFAMICAAFASRVFKSAIGFWARGIGFSIDLMCKDFTSPATPRNGIQLSPSKNCWVSPFRKNLGDHSIRIKGIQKRVGKEHKRTPCLITHDAQGAASRFSKLFQSVKAQHCLRQLVGRLVTTGQLSSLLQAISCHQRGDTRHRNPNKLEYRPILRGARDSRRKGGAPC